jgi:hypothetical protein
MTARTKRIGRRRRWPWIFLFLLVGLALLIPGLLGRFVHEQTSAWLTESWPEATVRWQRGWFASRVEAADRDAHLVLDARHSLLKLAGPLTADGTLTLARPDTRIAIDGRLSWAMDTEIEARSERLRANELVSIDAEQLRLALWRGRNGALDLQLDAASLAVSGPPDAVLTTRDTTLRITADGADPGTLAVDLSATQPGRPASRLSIEGRRIDAERGQTLLDALAVALETPPGSASASIAWLGVASAWEQLARAGLTIHLEPLALNGQLEINGLWIPAEGPPRWTGGGSQQALADWLIPILGLARSEPAARLREELALQFEAGSEQGVLRRDGGRFELLPPPPAAR